MIGAIADDFTGGTDVAVAFRRAGLRTVLLFGVPSSDVLLPDHDAIVVALKTRTIDAADAVSQSVAAAEWLREHGAEQFFFKYCSTFDSRSDGNIGPVADALADLLGASRAAVVPSSPEHGRTQYLGHLFVGRQLLSDSPMRFHPLTPMTDPFIPRVLASQTEREVGLISHEVVRAGRDALRAELERSDARYVVIDAVSDADLLEIGHACVDDVLVTGAAGLAGGLGIARAGRLHAGGRADRVDDPVGDVPTAVLAGSCSARTLDQVAHMRATHASFQLDALSMPDATELAAQALAWVDDGHGRSPLIYSSMPPAELARTQQVLGVAGASEILETAMGLIARGLLERGVRRLVVAGGETSGAVVTTLDVTGGMLGDELAPGVPWIYTTGDQPMALLLKSGNFGDVDLLTRASASDAERTAAA